MTAQKMGPLRALRDPNTRITRGSDPPKLYHPTLDKTRRMVEFGRNYLARVAKWGDGGGLLARRRKTVASVKMKPKAVPISRIAMVARQENACCTLLTSVCYAKWPATFGGGGS